MYANEYYGYDSDHDKKKKPRRNPISVADTIGMYPDRIWYPIGDKFRGYEVSEDGHVRSIKLFYNKGGCLIPVRYNKKKEAFGYELVDSEGRRHLVTLDEIWEMVEKNKHAIPKKTDEIQVAGRNRRVFQKHKYVKQEYHNLIMPSFTVIKDTETNKPERKIVCPIYDLDKPEVYYGRSKEERQ